VRHTLGQTVLDRLRTVGSPELLLTVARSGTTVGAVLREDGRNAVVSALPPAYAVAADGGAAAADPDLPAVIGPIPEAEAYAAAFVARTAARVEIAMRTRLFRLVTLTPPQGVPGAARVAGAEDVDLIAGLQAAFHVEAVRALDPPANPRPGLVESMRRGAGHLLWEVDGAAVAYATARCPVAGMSRVGPSTPAPAPRPRLRVRRHRRRQPHLPPVRRARAGRDQPGPPPAGPGDPRGRCRRLRDGAGHAGRRPAGAARRRTRRDRPRAFRPGPRRLLRGVTPHCVAVPEAGCDADVGVSCGVSPPH
jgi:hypothetical protein